MDLGLRGRIAVVSGASAGIGRETAKVLAEEGVQTVVLARRQAQLDRLADEIEASGGARPMVVVADLNDRSAFDRVRDQVVGRFGRVDIVVNNLGQSRPLAVVSPDSEWDEAFGLNFTPTRKLAEAFIPVMQQRKFGRIVNLTATLEPGHVSGSLTSKAAVLVWAKGLSRCVARDGITVNCVSPGILLTDQILHHYFPRVMPTKEDQERFLRQELPAGRFGEPNEAAHIIAFLCSTKAAYITGQQLYVDGGWNRHV